MKRQLQHYTTKHHVKKRVLRFFIFFKIKTRF